MAKRKIKIDFSKVENIKFTCIEYCGKCCFYQAPALTTTEINRVLTYLKTRSYEEFESFALDCLTNLGRLADEELLKKYVEGLMWFWSPFLLEEVEEGILVRNYTLHSMPSSGRCKLLNPINQKCFVYPTRPDTCRLYPFTEKIDKTGTFSIELIMENCPGISRGPTNLDKEEIQQLVMKGLIETEKDVIAYEKYILDKNIKRLSAKKKKREYRERKDIDRVISNFEKHWRDVYFFGKKQRRTFKGKRFIEPLAELGMIPRHPLLVLWNEQLDKSR